MDPQALYFKLCMLILILGNTKNYLCFLLFILYFMFIDEDLSDAIYECMMIRIKDKFPAIRIQAVLALVRLQDPEDDECPVIGAFLHSMKTDTNADVRKTILSNIALSRKTLPCVLGVLSSYRFSLLVLHVLPTVFMHC